MIDSAFQWITAMIGVAFVSALAEPLLNKAALKQVLRVITAASLIAILLSPLLHPDVFAYASVLRRESTSDLWDPDAAAEQDRLLNRTLIESECSAYILDKGKSLNIPIEEVHVSVCWDTEGYWVPERVQIVVTHESEQSEELCDVIETDLGIARNAQEWSIAHEQ